MEIGKPKHYRWLRGIVFAIFGLNVIDGLFTVYWVASGWAEEANPLMDGLLDISPGLFMFGKLSLVGFGSVLLWRLRTRPGAVIALFVLFLVYYFLTLYHLHFLDLGLLSS